MSEILFELKENIAQLTLNRPEKLNAFNRSMSLELQDQLLACDENDAVRAVVLTGAGRAFCSGQDLSEFPPGQLPDFEKGIDENYNPIIRLLKTIRKPVLCCRKWCCSRSRRQYRPRLRHRGSGFFCSFCSGIFKNRTDTGLRGNIFLTQTDRLAESYCPDDAGR